MLQNRLIGGIETVTQISKKQQHLTPRQANTKARRSPLHPVCCWPNRRWGEQIAAFQHVGELITCWVVRNYGGNSLQFKCSQFSTPLSPSVSRSSPPWCLWHFDVSIFTPYQFRAQSDLSLPVTFLPWPLSLSSLSVRDCLVWQECRPCRGSSRHSDHTLFSLWSVDKWIIRLWAAGTPGTFPTVHKHLFVIRFEEKCFVGYPVFLGPFATYNLRQGATSPSPRRFIDSYLTLSWLFRIAITPQTHNPWSRSADRSEVSLCTSWETKTDGVTPPDSDELRNEKKRRECSDQMFLIGFFFFMCLYETHEKPCMHV